MSIDLHACERLKTHTVSFSDEDLGEKVKLRSYLEHCANDFRCMAEHDLIGSTSLQVNNPWIPYAVLAGRSVAEVNVKRSSEGMQYLPSEFFGLVSRDYIVLATVPLADEHTGVIGEFEIFDVKCARNGNPIPRDFWKDQKYIGPTSRYPHRNESLSLSALLDVYRQGNLDISQ